MKTKLSSLFRASLCALCLCGALLFGTGCSTLTDQPLLAQVAVQYATIKVVQDNPERAQRVATIARSLADTATGEAAATVAILERFVREQVRWERLDAADTLLVETLIAGISAELTARLGSGVLSPEQRVVVAQVAAWIEAAASAANPQTLKHRNPETLSHEPQRHRGTEIRSEVFSASRCLSGENLSAIGVVHRCPAAQGCAAGPAPAFFATTAAA